MAASLSLEIFSRIRPKMVLIQNRRRSPNRSSLVDMGALWTFLVLLGLAPKRSDISPSSTSTHGAAIHESVTISAAASESGSSLRSCGMQTDHPEGSPGTGCREGVRDQPGTRKLIASLVQSLKEARAQLDEERGAAKTLEKVLEREREGRLRAEQKVEDLERDLEREREKRSHVEQLERIEGDERESEREREHLECLVTAAQAVTSAGRDADLAMSESDEKGRALTELYLGHHDVTAACTTPPPHSGGPTGGYMVSRFIQRWLWTTRLPCNLELDPGDLLVCDPLPARCANRWAYLRRRRPRRQQTKPGAWWT